MAIKIFKRYEKKYILNEEQYKDMIKLLNQYMELDKYCKKNNNYTIYNIYFDNKADDIIVNCMGKPYFKEKLRLRSYKLLNSDKDEVFFEIKRKINRIVSKRRVKLQMREIKRILNENKMPNSLDYFDKQVIQEIQYFIKRWEVSPKVFIKYDRLAYFLKSNKNFRVTFDTNIKCRRNDLNFYSDKYQTKLIEADKYLMEIKTNTSIPIWLTQKLNELKLYSTSFSKYKEEYKLYLSENLNKSRYISNDKKINQMKERG